MASFLAFIHSFGLALGSFISVLGLSHRYFPALNPEFISHLGTTFRLLAT